MNNCDHCNKKIKGLIKYKCKCEYNTLCSSCRLPETHDCKFNFKAEGKKIIENNNPKIIAQKVINL